MDFELSEERRMLADTAARFIRDQYPLARRHAAAAAERGFDPAVWADLADLGLIGALLPPEADGFGGLGEDLMVVFEALGRGIVVEPFLASGVLGATPVLRLGSPGQRALLAEVAAGTRLIALAHGEPAARYAPTHVATRAAETAEGWRLTGAKAVVLNGDSADTLVVSARVAGEPLDADGIALFLVEPSAPGVTVRGYGTVEGGRAAEIALVAAPAQPLGTPGAAWPVLEETLARGAFALSAEAVGIMDVCKEMTLDYLKTRQQFGRPIGANQVLQHRMVDLYVEVEQARSAVMLAAGYLDGPRAMRERTVAAAKNLAGRVGQLVAEEAIQLHGGIAMTWEYALPHFAKRLVMIDHLLGDADHHARRYLAFATAA
ncbi:MAG: acyl-CoA dehydrogenase family protein [Pseudomonadota bacterium]